MLNQCHCRMRKNRKRKMGKVIVQRRIKGKKFVFSAKSYIIKWLKRFFKFPTLSLTYETAATHVHLFIMSHFRALDFCLILIFDLSKVLPSLQISVLTSLAKTTSCRYKRQQCRPPVTLSVARLPRSTFQKDSFI